MPDSDPMAIDTSPIIASRGLPFSKQAKPLQERPVSTKAGSVEAGPLQVRLPPSKVVELPTADGPVPRNIYVARTFKASQVFRPIDVDGEYRIVNRATTLRRECYLSIQWHEVLHVFRY